MSVTVGDTMQHTVRVSNSCNKHYESSQGSAYTCSVAVQNCDLSMCQALFCPMSPAFHDQHLQFNVSEATTLET